MRIDFRQGIITYPSVGQNQTFLLYSGGYVSLSCSNGRVDVAFAHLSENYLLSESADVSNAWGPLSPGVDYWLYWDVDLRTAVRTFGVTTLQPTTSTIQPPVVEGQHWFNPSTTTMYVASSGVYRPVARVFAAKIKDSALTPLGTGVPNKPYAGTQVGVTTQGSRVGRILVDDAGKPVKRLDGRFFTTETDFFVDGSPVNVTSLEGAVVTATAVTVLPKFHVVKFTEFGSIDLATYDDVQTSTIALLTEDLTTHQVGTVVIQGYVSNPDWNWPALSNLWVNDTGSLVDVDPHLADPLTYPEAKPPVARVVSQTSVIFDQGLGGIGARGPAGVPGANAVIPIASDSAHGAARLSTPAVNVQDPIVVGNNDPRLTDARTPLAHDHSGVYEPIDITILRDVDVGVSVAAQTHVHADYVDVGGDTMTGYLSLHADPTSALHAATKQYVDAIPMGISISEEGSVIEAVTNSVNFIGAGVTATSPSAGVVNVTVEAVQGMVTLGKTAVGSWTAGAIQSRSSNGCAPLAWAESTTNKVMLPYLAFDASNIEYAQFSFKAPSVLDEATLTIKFVWKEAVGSTFHDVVWGAQALALSDGEVVDTAFGSVATIVDTGTVGTLHHTAEIVVTPGNTWVSGDTIVVQVFRDATNVSDTLTVDAHLVEVVVYANYVSLVEA